MGVRFLTGGESSPNGIIGLDFVFERSVNEGATAVIAPATTGFALRLYPKGWGVYTGAIQHVSKRNVFAMLEWLHEQQAKPRKELFNQKEVLYDQNRSINVGL